MKILMVTPSYKSRSRPLMKTRSLERTPPQKKIGFAPLITLPKYESVRHHSGRCKSGTYLCKVGFVNLFICNPVAFSQSPRNLRVTPAIPEVMTEVLPLIRMIVYFNFPLQICEPGCILEVPLHNKGLIKLK